MKRFIDIVIHIKSVSYTHLGVRIWNGDVPVI